MRERLLSIFRFLLARPGLYKFNRFLFEISLRGLGVRNFGNKMTSGESHFLRTILNSAGRGGSAVVFDVGANKGEYSKAIQAIAPEATIYAFEPHPVTFAELTANVGGPRFFPINLAVGASKGRCRLFDYERPLTSSHASLHKAVIEKIHAADAIHYDVDVVELDSFSSNKAIERIDLLKIDTEGHEYQVLLGCKRLLAERRIDNIHFEFNEMNTISRVFFRDFVDLLQGYDLFRLLPHGLLPLSQYDASSQEIFAYQNIVALKR